MKMCPVCKKTYDDSYDYCEVDGALLVEGAPEEKISSKPSPVSNKPVAKASMHHKCPVCGWEGDIDDEYCPECGAKLIEVNSTENISSEKTEKTVQEVLILPDSTEIKIETFPFEFGRDLMSRYPESDIISRKHFSITMIENNGQREYMIEDLNSLNGTAVNQKVIGYDRKSNGKVPLHDGDKISLCIDPKTGSGKFEFTFKVRNLSNTA